MDKLYLMSGGLGNQLCEYAFLYKLRKQGLHFKIDLSLYNTATMHNGYELERVFGLKDNIIKKTGFHLLLLRLIRKCFPFLMERDSNVRNLGTVIKSRRPIFYGVWGDEKYIGDVIPEFAGMLEFQNIDGNTLEEANRMSSCDSVSVHIRRGDFASFGVPLLGENYYKKAIEYIKNKIKSPVFFVFSDDKDVANEIMKKMNVTFFIENGNTGLDSYKDMYLMSKCKHNIMANSTFSMWGTFLNKNPKKIVVQPKGWIEYSGLLGEVHF